MEVFDIMGSVESILNLCKTIYNMVEKMKTNKERCQRIAERVKALGELVLTLKKREPCQITDTVANALKQLCITLTSAKELIMKYSQSHTFKKLLYSGSHEENFSKVNEKLTDTFQILSGALQIEHGNILYKVFENVLGRKQGEEYYSTAPSTMPSSPPCSPVTSMPVPYNPVTPIPVRYTMPSPLPCNPVAPTPVRCMVITKPLYRPVTTMPVLRIVSPVRVAAPVHLPVNMAATTKTITPVYINQVRLS